ncbi:hypothetical protein [Mycolicibacterium mageritense]|uniref:hypothetical protein n=1 Tax=Mycolicibacterium mageritense TaxID=53462 RepID=UPI00093FE6D6|nr:hypothetical protein [Mycolicibacterium mageritense]OKH78860.1 hypothetical protein EB73_37180 [Mycobacterium sp. SWH-M3]GJJ20531.1 hypothetical protein MTY414_42040 [Mycolicibacterium mageritense]
MEPDDFADRVSRLESENRKLNERVRSSEQDAAAARILAGAADRDVSELSTDVRAIRGEVGELRGEAGDHRKATAASFNAMRADFAELRSDFAGLRSEMNTRFAQVDAGFIEMRGRLDATAAGQAHIAGLLQRLIDDQNPS